MTFEYGDRMFNLLDTPGHQDFSEDTYRTLTAADSAVMVHRRREGHRGPDAQAVRGLPAARHPIVTFINKIDREGRDPFELLDESSTRRSSSRHTLSLISASIRNSNISSTLITSNCTDIRFARAAD